MTARARNRQEMILYRKAYRNLRSQSYYLRQNGEDLYDNVWLWAFSRYDKGHTFTDSEVKAFFQSKDFSSLNEFWRNMGLWKMVDDFKINVQKALKIGYKTEYRRQRAVMEQFGISFDLQNPAVTQYADNFSSLHLSDRHGSINLTTKDRVIGVLKEGLNNQESYTEVATRITDIDDTLFGKNRAKLIATNEIGKAYSYGNYVPMRELADQGAIVEKKRSTVGDDRVTPECSSNASAGRIGIDEDYPSGDDVTPRTTNPRCRCTDLYRVQ